MGDVSHENLKRTPLFEEHVRAGARMVPFAGWEMPVMYTNIIEEHKTVREKVGLFDVSHMGEVWVSGPKALETLQWLTPNDVSKLKTGEAQYSLLSMPNGGVVDDIIIYCFEPGIRYLVCVNASNIEKDFDWMKTNNRGAELKNASSEWGQIAIQGPKALALIEDVLSGGAGNVGVAEMKSFTFRESSFAGVSVIFARTGYTGEDGGEIFVPAGSTAKLWQELLERGKKFGVAPIGLGARDTLRMEMKYPLYGQELTSETNPIEARLGWVVKLKKGDFIGRGPIADQAEKGAPRHLVGLKLLDKGIPRTGYVVVSEGGETLGEITSGTMSPSLGEPIGIAYVKASHSKEGTQLFVDIRGRKVKAQVVATPFVRRA